jgi:hypothetical protein
VPRDHRAGPPLVLAAELVVVRAIGVWQRRVARARGLASRVNTNTRSAVAVQLSNSALRVARGAFHLDAPVCAVCLSLSAVGEGSIWIQLVHKVLSE